jgi:hypothetical protein
MRVQIPAYTDRWMMGDRYGEVIKITKMRSDYAARLGHAIRKEIVHVKLDKSGKTMKFLLDDCEEVT